uniref:Coiled-coil domain containing 167 n=1 Tax=Steinernema glaseri TaxID=37863 RepID=A0A1I8A0J2_9BILA
MAESSALEGLKEEFRRWARQWKEKICEIEREIRGIEAAIQETHTRVTHLNSESSCVGPVGEPSCSGLDSERLSFIEHCLEREQRAQRRLVDRHRQLTLQKQEAFALMEHLFVYLHILAKELLS